MLLSKTTWWRPCGGHHHLPPRFDTGRNDDFHELIQGQLRAPLTPGKKYRIELYVNQSDATALHHCQGLYGEKRDIRPTAAGNLGLVFLYDKKTTSGKRKPQFVVTEPIVTGKDEWKLDHWHLHRRPGVHVVHRRQFLRRTKTR
ncbi:MAG: hypothetical protein IPM82_17185 [Saprospiraceae bacterium]|nr:hypothetical protein [Saprospiraceae bacterium]